MYTMTTWFASNVIKIVMTDAMRVVNADMDNIILSMYEDAHIIGKLVIHVMLLYYNNGIVASIMVESIRNCMRIAILCTPIQALALYRTVKFTEQYREVNNNLSCTDEIDGNIEWTRYNDMIEVRDNYDLFASCTSYEWNVNIEHFKLELKNEQNRVISTRKQWHSLVQILECCCWFMSHIVFNINVLLRWSQWGNICSQFVKKIVWTGYLDYWHTPYYLYFDPRYLQPPTNEVKEEPVVEVLDEVNPVKVDVPTNPLEDLPGLRWNHFSLSPLPINLNRARRWLNSRKKRSTRRVSKLNVGKCPHKTWAKEWEII